MEKITKVLDRQDEIVEKIENEIINDIEKEMKTEKEEQKTIKARKTKKSRVVLNKYEVASEAEAPVNKTETEEKPKLEPVLTGEKKKIVVKQITERGK